MTGWQEISTAPQDGSLVRLRREVGGHVYAEGPGRFDRLARDLPGLSRALRYWVQPDGLALWGGPTHWRPA